MRRLSNVSRVKPVMVGHVKMIVILQRHHIGDERIGWNLERLQEVSLLQEVGIKIRFECRLDGRNKNQFLIADVGHNKSFLNKKESITWKMAYMTTVSG